MPLPREDIEDLDPTDPADAAVLQTEALAYFDQAAALDADLSDANIVIEEVTQDVQDAQRRFYAATAYVSRQPAGIRLARRAT